MRASLTFLLPLLALLGACASPDGLGPRGRISEGAQLAQANPRSLPTKAQAAPADARWWQQYGDAQLDQLIDQALAASPSLELAQARLDQARAAAGLAASADGLHANANIDSTQQRLSEHYIYPTGLAGTYTSINRAALDFSYTLDLWGRNRAALAAALGQEAAARADLAQARLILASAITRSYIQLDRVLQQRQVAAARLAQQQALGDLIRQRQAAGLETRAEVQQSHAQTDNAQAELIALDAQATLLRHQLAALAGQGPDQALALHAPQLRDPGTPPATLPADLLGQRPDLRALRWRVEAGQDAAEAARAEFYPNVDLTGFVGLQSLGLDPLAKGGSRILGVGPAIHLPIFDQGRLRAQLAERFAEQDAAIAQYNGALVNALREVADPLAQWRAASAETQVREAALAGQQAAWNLARQRQQAGLSSQLPVLNAQSPILLQQGQLADLRARRLDASAALHTALGGGYSPATAEPISH